MNRYFKIYPGQWEHPIKPENLIEAISFVFTMRDFPGLYFKLKHPIDNIFGLDCFQFEFDTDNGIYIKDGDMRFNHFMGSQIKDSGVDVVQFITEYLIQNGNKSLIQNNP